MVLGAGNENATDYIKLTGGIVYYQSGDPRRTRGIGDSYRGFDGKILKKDAKMHINQRFRFESWCLATGNLRLAADEKYIR
jgi:hypothetical protein